MNLHGCGIHRKPLAASIIRVLLGLLLFFLEAGALAQCTGDATRRIRPGWSCPNWGYNYCKCNHAIKWQYLVDGQVDKDKELDLCNSGTYAAHLACADFRSNLRFSGRPVLDDAGLHVRYAIDHWHLGRNETPVLTTFVILEDGRIGRLGEDQYTAKRQGENEIVVPLSRLRASPPGTSRLHILLDAAGQTSERDENDNQLFVELPNFWLGQPSRRTAGGNVELTVDYFYRSPSSEFRQSISVSTYWRFTDRADVLIHKEVRRPPAVGPTTLGVGNFTVGGGKLNSPPSGVQSIIVRIDEENAVLEASETDNEARFDLPDYSVVALEWMSGGALRLIYDVRGGATLSGQSPEISFWWKSPKGSIKKVRPTYPRLTTTIQTHEFRYSSRDMGVPPEGADRIGVTLDVSKASRESNEDNNYAELQFPQLSYEIRDAPAAATMDERMLLWVERHCSKIRHYANAYNIDPRAIVAAIVWEATENVRRPPRWSQVASDYLHFIRGVGPGKVHVKDTLFPTTLFDADPVAEQVEQLGYLPRRTIRTRTPYLKTTKGSVEYIAAIMNAYATEADNYYGIRRNPAVLASLFQGTGREIKDIIEQDYFASRRAFCGVADTLSPPGSDPARWMGSWAVARADYLSDATRRMRWRLRSSHPVPTTAPWARGSVPVTCYTCASGLSPCPSPNPVPTPSAVPSALEVAELAVDVRNGQIVLSWSEEPESKLQRGVLSNGELVWTDMSETLGKGLFTEELRSSPSFYRVVTDVSIPDEDGGSLSDDDFPDTEPLALAPELVSPSDRQTLVPIEGTLQWSTLPGVHRYRLVVSRDYDGAVVFDSEIPPPDQGLAELDLTGLVQPNRRYLWRVAGVNGAGEGPFSEMWSFTTEDDAVPGPPIQILPWNGAEDVAVNVLLDWNSVPRATGYDWQVYEGGAVVAEGGPIAGTSVRVQLQHRRSYTWRVRARVLPQNNPWSEQWAFTTERPPEPPSQIAPVNGATDVTILVKLDWERVPGAEGYDYQVYQGDTLVRSGGPIASTAVFVDLDPRTAYRWRVRARILPQNNAWSEFWTFTTGNALPEVDPPSQISPANGATGIFTSVQLDWQAIDGASGYDFEVYEGSTLVLRNEGGPMAGTAVTVALNYNTTYRWRVRARVLPQDNPWSSFWTLTTRPPPGPPALISPANGASGLNVSVTLDWSSISEADGYDWEVYDGASKVAGFGISYDGPYRGTSATLSLQYGKSYRWRARARVLPQDNTWSDFATFSTKPVPTPVLVSPANGATGLSPSLVLDWTSVPDAGGYDWELYDGTEKIAGFGISYEGPYSGTSVGVSLQYSKTYRWRARARILPQDNPWSEFWSFSTQEPPPVYPGIPQLVSPANHATGVGRPTNLDWRAAPNASSYQVEIYYQPSSGGSRQLVERVTTSATSHDSQELQSGRNYYWKVRGRNAAGYGDWSSEWHFATRVSAQ